MSARSLGGAALVASVIVLTSACSSDSSSSSQSKSVKPIDACAVVTAADAGTALGGAVGTGVPQSTDRTDTRVSTCRYTQTNDPARDVNVAVQEQNGQGERRDQVVKSLREGDWKDKPVAEIKELGDVALFAQGRLNQLAILQDDYFMLISFPPNVTQDAAVNVGRAALGRLPKG